MRVLLFCGDPGVPVYGPSGSSAHLRGVARGLVGLGYEVAVAALRASDARGVHGEALGVPVIPAPPRRWPAGLRGFGLRRDRARLARRAGRDFDLVWERASAGCDAGLRLARRVGCPHLLELNAPLALEQGRDSTATAVLSGADRVVAVSDWLVRYAHRHGARDAVCVENASDLRPGSREAGRERLGDGLILVHHGSLKPWHGLDRMPAVLDALPEARLVVVGQGTVPVHPRIVQLPHAGHGALADLLAGADVAVAPYPDAAPPWLDPLKIHDCRAVGLPVIGSTHPAAHGADQVVPLGDVEGWVRGIRGLAGRPRVPVARAWTAVCREALRGITAG